MKNEDLKTQCRLRWKKSSRRRRLPASAGEPEDKNAAMKKGKKA
jgi:hypothetical protein